MWQGKYCCRVHVLYKVTCGSRVCSFLVCKTQVSSLRDANKNLLQGLVFLEELLKSEWSHNFGFSSLQNCPSKETDFLCPSSALLSFIVSPSHICNLTSQFSPLMSEKCKISGGTWYLMKDIQTTSCLL